MQRIDPDDTYDESTNPSNGWTPPQHPNPENRVRGLIDEAQIHLGDAIDALVEASSLSRKAGGPYWLHGQLDAYTVPTLRAFQGETRHQPGALGSMIEALDAEAGSEDEPAVGWGQ